MSVEVSMCENAHLHIDTGVWWVSWHVGMKFGMGIEVWHWHEHCCGSGAWLPVLGIVGCFCMRITLVHCWKCMIKNGKRITEAC